jgi:hypothetical protein
MSTSKSFVANHPWLTFFLGLAVVDGVVTIVRGRPQPLHHDLPPRPDLPRGTYR